MGSHRSADRRAGPEARSSWRCSRFYLRGFRAANHGTPRGFGWSRLGPATTLEIFIDKITAIRLEFPAEKVLECYAPERHVPAATECGTDRLVFETELLHGRPEMLAQDLFE